MTSNTATWRDLQPAAAASPESASRFAERRDLATRLHERGLLEALLADQTTGKPVIWATDTYACLGEGYGSQDSITPAKILGRAALLADMRKSRRPERTRKRGEVFTPFWICRQMCDFAHAELPSGCWQDYVKARTLEIACGEAPFLASRRDLATGAKVRLADRIGLLDRKLQAVSANARDHAEWLEWALIAFESSYAYEFQGDNLVSARLSLVRTFEEYLQARWGIMPTASEYERLLAIVTWNVWQMDGLKGVIPFGQPASSGQLNMLGGSDGASPCLVRDWRRDANIPYSALAGRNTMKFDFIIGNPPYQEEKVGTSDSPVYNLFMDECYKIAHRAEFISPARFLFDAGKTPREWNKKMLEDTHLKVMYYWPTSSEIFYDTDIKGGVAITYRDSLREFDPIQIYSPFPVLNDIRRKIEVYIDKGTLTDIMVLQNRFNLNKLLEDFPEYKTLISSDGKEKRIVSSSFDKLPIFHDDNIYEDGVRILGILSPNRRIYKWVERKYIVDSEIFGKWKVLVSKTNNKGELGETLASPEIGEPDMGFTQSFISVGLYDTKSEAQNALKYIKTKFARILLGILKITQDNPPEKWKYVPLQDFTPNSDIDWSKSIPEIDRQLYAKYGLDEQEIEFIETHVKEMA